MGHRCAVTGCSSTSPAVLMHRFPVHNQQLCEIWLDRIGIVLLPKDFALLSRKRICSKHFHSMNKLNSTGHSLLMNSIPSINLPNFNKKPTREICFFNKDKELTQGNQINSDLECNKRPLDEPLINKINKKRKAQLHIIEQHGIKTLNQNELQMASFNNMNSLESQQDITNNTKNNDNSMEPPPKKSLNSPHKLNYKKKKSIIGSPNNSNDFTNDSKNNLYNQLNSGNSLTNHESHSSNYDSKHKNSNEDDVETKHHSHKRILENNLEDCSFGTAIRQILLKNNTNLRSEISNNQSISEQQTLNVSNKEKSPEFTNLGNFYNLPDKVKDLFKQYKGIDELYEWQHECLNQAIGNRRNLIYSLPTSGGKTLVAEILMLREVMCYEKNAIFILPYVAIVQEKVWEFSPFAVALDFLIEEYASSKGVYPPRKRRRKHSIYIATIEKALGLINSLIETSRLDEIGLIVVDELHLIGESSRGATLENCLTKVMFLEETNIQIIGMSATIGNIEDICSFLNADIYVRNFRPVELTEYIKFDNQMARINWQCKNEEDLFVDIKELDFKYSEKLRDLDPDMIAGLALEIIPDDSCLIFCPSKRNCENVVHILYRLANPTLHEHKKLEKVQLLEALEEVTGQICDILKKSIPFGIAYHHSGLMNEERHLLEDAFRRGVISVICCTSTLAAGVNLPARRVIVRSPYIGKEFLNLSHYKQMVGRAGRAGLGQIGESIIIAQSTDLESISKLFLNPMNQALSNLHELNGYGLEQLLLSCISLGVANTRNDLERIVKFTLMAVQEQKLDINVNQLTQRVIKNLFKSGALVNDFNHNNEKRSQITSCNVTLSETIDIKNSCSINQLHSTPRSSSKTIIRLTRKSKILVSNLGRASVRSGLDLHHAHQLYDDLYVAQKKLVLLNCLHLLYLVTPYETIDRIQPNIPVYYDVLNHFDEKEKQTAKILGFSDGVIVKMAAGQVSKHIPENKMNRFYVTLIIYDLWNEVPLIKVAEKYQVNRGIIQNLMTTSATFASNVVNFCEHLEEFWAFTYLLKGMSQRLAHCCMKELLPLMELPSVKQGRAKQLFKAGYKNIQSVSKANVNDLVTQIEYMPRKVAAQLIAAAKMLILEKVENLREEAEELLMGTQNI